MRLHSVNAECYECGPVGFWEKMGPSYKALLPVRKFWNGRYFCSYYFTFTGPDYMRLIEAKQ